MSGPHKFLEVAVLEEGMTETMCLEGVYQKLYATDFVTFSNALINRVRIVIGDLLEDPGWIPLNRLLDLHRLRDLWTPLASHHDHRLNYGRVSLGVRVAS